MAGKKVNFADMADDPVLEAPVPPLPRAPSGPPSRVPLEQVAANPLNPRESLGDLAELAASLRAVGQLQPCAAVTRSAYLTVYPEHEAQIGTARYVAVTGGRRRAAAAIAELATLDIIVKDDLAASRERLATAAIAENIERRDFDVLEEARAVRSLVEMCGSGVAAGEQLSRTKGWVSQRLALLKLSGEMQDLLRAGTLPIREARRLASLPADEQLAAWEREQAQAAADRFTAVNQSTDDDGGGGAAEQPEAAPDGDESPKPRRKNSAAAAAVRKLGSDPETLAEALRSNLDADQLAKLIALLVGSAAVAT